MTFKNLQPSLESSSFAVSVRSLLLLLPSSSRFRNSPCPHSLSTILGNRLHHPMHVSRSVRWRRRLRVGQAHRATARRAVPPPTSGETVGSELRMGLIDLCDVGDIGGYHLAYLFAKGQLRWRWWYCFRRNVAIMLSLLNLNCIRILLVLYSWNYWPLFVNESLFEWRRARLYVWP